MTDRQFQSLRNALLLVALALFADAAVQLVPPARAGDSVDAKVDGAIDVNQLRITDFRDELVIERIRNAIEVEMEGPGSSSTRPLYIKIVE